MSERSATNNTARKALEAIAVYPCDFCSAQIGQNCSREDGTLFADNFGRPRAHAQRLAKRPKVTLGYSDAHPL